MSSVDLIIEMGIAVICFSFDIIYEVYELDTSYNCMGQNLLCTTYWYKARIESVTFVLGKYIPRDACIGTMNREHNMPKLIQYLRVNYNMKSCLSEYSRNLEGGIPCTHFRREQDRSSMRTIQMPVSSLCISCLCSIEGFPDC